MLKVAMIGLDSSHTVEFARRMKGVECSSDQHVAGLVPVSCCRFETPFQNQAGLDAREAVLRSMQIPVTDSLDEALSGADAIMLEINDPMLHVEYFEKVAALGKPVFLDKPLAENFAAGRRIVELAERHGTRFFTASALRYDKAVVAGAACNPNPARSLVWGPLGQAPAGSSIIWYGVHAVEMLQRFMGRGAEAVRVIADPIGLLAHIQYEGGRRGVVEMTRNNYRYGSVLHTADGSPETKFAIETGADFYGELLREVAAFFRGEAGAGVSVGDMLESMAILDAIDRAYVSGKCEEILH